MAFILSTWIAAGSVSSSFNSGPYDALAYTGGEMQLDVSGSGTPVGTFKIQGSDDATDWIDLSGTSLAITDDGNYRIQFNKGACRYIRLVYTRSSGTGSIDVALSLIEQSTSVKSIIQSGASSANTMSVDATSNAAHVSIYGGSSANVMAVDATSNAGHVTLYDTAGANVNSVSLGTTLGKTRVMQTGTVTTTATTADQVVLTYTTTAAKTTYLEYLSISAYRTTPSATAAVLGAASVEIVAGTKVLTVDLHNATTSAGNQMIFTFPEPLIVAASTVLRVVTTPADTTSTLWRANFGGFEKA